jgi:hypothetical protein
MLKHSTVDVHMRNDVMLQYLVSISDALRCTCHMHKSRPTTMMDSCPHHDTSATKSVDLLHDVWSITFYSTSTRARTSARDRRKRDSSENKTVLHLARVHLTLCWHHCRCSTKWRGVKTLRRTGLLGKIPASLSRLRTVWSEILRSPGICVDVVVAVVVRFRRLSYHIFDSILLLPVLSFNR